jgi:hypothetical protein
VGRKVYAVGRLLAPGDAVVAEAEAVFITVDPARFSTT